MSFQLSTLYLAVQRKFNDYSAYTLDLILEAVNDRVKELEDAYVSPSLIVSHTFTPTINSKNKDLSSYTPEDLRCSGVIKIQNDATGLPLQRMSLTRFIELGQGVSTNTADTARAWIPVTDTSLYLNPIPTTATTYTLYGTKKHPFMSTAAQYFHFSDDEVDIIKTGVIADIYEDKDDTRYALWQKKFQDGIKDKRRKQKLAEGQNIRLLPGDSIEM